MWKNGVRKADLARSMNLHRQEIDRLLDLNHATSLAKIEKALSGETQKIDSSDPTESDDASEEEIRRETLEKK